MQRNIVFVDDENDLCEMYEELFKSKTNIVKAFSCIKTALEYIQGHNVDICFIDYRMPIMNGIEFRKHLSENIVCILLTGELDARLEVGFVAVFNKPLDEQMFEQIIDKYCPTKA